MVYDIITLGSATVDVFAKTNSKHMKVKHKSYDEEFIAYPLGSKVLIDDLDFQIGGGGTNTAVAASRLGLKTAYLGCVGKDLNGEKVLDLLKKENVDFIGMRSDVMTNYSVILDTKSGDRTILVYKGASTMLEFDKAKRSKLGAKWFYLCAMVDNGFKELVKAAEYARKKGIGIAFNPSSYLAKKGKRYLNRILELTDILILNKEEAEMIAGKTKKNDLLAKKLCELGPKNVVITDGKKKVTVLYQGIIYGFTPKRSKCTEATGAGDAFGSTFLASLISGRDVKDSIEDAFKNSRSVISHIGAKDGLLTREDLND